MIPRVLALLFAALSAISAQTGLEMPKVFTDNMVLQRDIPVPIWGWADPGQKVEVKFKGQEKSAVAGADGKWLLRLAPLAASAEPEKLLVTTPTEKKEFGNVLVGDVWVCSGQSNMQFHMMNLAKPEDEIKQADYPQIRLLDVPNKSIPIPQTAIEGKGWQVCTPNNVSYFSAAGYFFGRKLFQELNIPIGLINSSWGGTRIEPWTPPEGLSTPGEAERIRSEFSQMTFEDKKAIVEGICGKPESHGAMRYKRAKEEWKWPEEKIIDSILCNDYFPQKAACIYNGKIHPLIPYGIKGAIWYQGESNASDVDYAEKQQALVKSWRNLWQVGDFPFYIVQLAPYIMGKESLPPFWVQQYDAVRKIKNCGIASTVDISDLNDIHPKNKQDVGLRLALLALKDTYGKKDLVASGPTYKSLEIAGDKLTVHFDNTGSGLTTKDGKDLNCFEIAGADKSFHPAKASIKGLTVEVGSPEVKSPEYLRFAWSGVAEPNLRNQEGLPAFPFNTSLPFFQPELPLILGTVKLLKSDVGITIKSQSSIPLRGALRIKSAAFASDASANYELAPGEEKSLRIPVALKKDAPPAFDITVMMTAQGKILSFPRQVKNTPVFELKEGVWTERFNIEKLNGGDKPSSSSDLSASFALSFEKNTLLLNIKAKDDRPGNFTTPETPWEEDCLELFLDMNPLQTKDFNYPDKYADSTYQISISPNRKSGSRVYSKIPLKGLTVKPEIKNTPDGYEADIRIEVSESLKGRFIGFELSVDDSDTGRRKTQLVWNNIGPNYLDRSNWRLLHFD